MATFTPTLHFPPRKDADASVARIVADAYPRPRDYRAYTR